MRTFVISDIHGDNTAFRKALKSVKLKKTDSLILLGDYIDRGYDSKGVLDTILLLKENEFNVTCLKGNHEEMFLDAFKNKSAYNNWILNGGRETLSSFLTSSIEKIPARYIELIDSFKYYHQNDNFIFVHAALNMFLDNPYEDLETILWSREPYQFLNNSWLGKRTIIHGHNPKSQNAIIESIKNNEKIICIDNGSFVKKDGYGSICILQLETLEINFINENN